MNVKMRMPVGKTQFVIIFLEVTVGENFNTYAVKVMYHALWFYVGTYRQFCWTKPKWINKLFFAVRANQVIQRLKLMPDADLFAQTQLVQQMPSVQQSIVEQFVLVWMDLQVFYNYWSWLTLFYKHNTLSMFSTGNPVGKDGCHSIADKCRSDAECSEAETCVDHFEGKMCDSVCSSVICEPSTICVGKNHIAKCQCKLFCLLKWI